jgi:hypothetical protein
VYNTNTKLLSMVRLTVEFFSSGAVFVRAHVRMLCLWLSTLEPVSVVRLFFFSPSLAKIKLLK